MVRVVPFAAGLAGGVGLLIAFGGRGRPARRRRHHLVGRVHHVRGRARGLWYRLRRRHPDEQVGDLVLADRIRSSLGPLEHALDQPRVHVSVHRHVATLHGDVANDYAADRLEAEVRSVAGVVGVRSLLHVGLLPGDGCPSDGAVSS